MFYIKTRMKGDKAWWFLTSKGGTNRLRIYAARFETRGDAQKIIDDNTDDNPEWEWKVVK